MAEKKKRTGRPEPSRAMPLGRTNYLVIAGGAALIVLSFWAMAIEHRVDGFFALNVAPVLLVGAYAAVAFGILIRPRRH